MNLSYKAVSREGQIIKGALEAKDIKEAAMYLRNKGFIPITITVQKDYDFQKYLPFGRKFKVSDLTFFTRQLASMITAGLTLVEALVILRDQTQNLKVKMVLGGIISDLEEGHSFASALAKYPNIFSPVYVSLIKAGESSGLLDNVLLRLASNLEKQQKVKGAFKSALVYPVIIIIGMIAVVVLMMIFVIPQLNRLYSNLNIDLPVQTKIIVGVSDIILGFWPLIIGVVVILLFAFNRWKKTETGKLILDDFVLKIPLFGQLVKQAILSEITRTLGLLIGSGTLVVEAIRETSGVANNILYKNAMDTIASRVEKGMTIGDSVKYSPLFPPLLVELIRVGEQTGKVDESLLRISEYYEQQVDQSVKGLTAALEPILMIILGLGVGFLILSVITPIYNLTSTLQ